MAHTHYYHADTVWHGSPIEGNKHIRSYDRSHTVSIAGKPDLHLTTDNKAVGDKNKLNPEDLVVAALSSCHMLSYLYVCALEGIVITSYEDHAEGTMVENENGGGSFSAVVLNPVFTVAHPQMEERALALHHQAHEVCYIANSVNFEVKCNPVCRPA
jgi:organic hydroperoxide reductase OsmC/OhrA